MKSYKFITACLCFLFITTLAFAGSQMNLATFREAKLQDSALSDDGTAIVQTYSVNRSRDQLTERLAWLQGTVVDLNSEIASVQEQLAMFPAEVVPAPPISIPPVDNQENAIP